MLTESTGVYCSVCGREVTEEEIEIDECMTCGGFLEYGNDYDDAYPEY